MDEEKLTEMSIDIKWIKCAIEKHLSHHSKLFFAGIAITGSLVAALILLVLSGCV